MEDSLQLETKAKMRCQESLADRSDAADAAVQTSAREYAALSNAFAEACLLLRDRSNLTDEELNKLDPSHPRFKREARGTFDDTESEDGLSSLEGSNNRR